MVQVQFLPKLPNTARHETGEDGTPTQVFAEVGTPTLTVYVRLREIPEHHAAHFKIQGTVDEIMRSAGLEPASGVPWSGEAVSFPSHVFRYWIRSGPDASENIEQFVRATHDDQLPASWKIIPATSADDTAAVYHEFETSIQKARAMGQNQRLQEAVSGLSDTAFYQAVQHTAGGTSLNLTPRQPTPLKRQVFEPAEQEAILYQHNDSALHDPMVDPAEEDPRGTRITLEQIAVTTGFTLDG